MPNIASDTSVVFCRSMLDANVQSAFPKEWIFETDEDIDFADTEEEACEMQRKYRKRKGFDEITGLPT